MAKKLRNIPTADADWTLMLYMAAGKSSDLDTVAVRDLQEIERGIRALGPGNPVRVFIQIGRHWPRAIQRYRIDYSGTHLVQALPAKTGMGKGKTLSDFLTWVAGKKAGKATKYGLILWGHAYGLGFGRDHGDPLTLEEIQKALADFEAARRKSWPEGGGKLELLGANACAMSYVEAAFQLRDSAELMVASQITVPFAGWPYEAILTRLTAPTTPLALGQTIVDAYVNQFRDVPTSEKLAMTILNLPAARGLDQKIHKLASAVEQAIRANDFKSETVSLFRDIFTSATGGDVRPLIDLTRLCEALLSEQHPAISSSDITTSADELLDAIRPSSKDTALILCHTCHAELDDVKGVGIFVPAVSDEGMLKTLELEDRSANGSTRGAPVLGRDSYEQLAVFNDGGKNYRVWPALVYDGLRREIPRDLTVAIDGIAEMQDGDRADVAQIILAIESSLNQFDRAIARAKKDIPLALTTTPVTTSITPGQRQRSFSRPFLRLLPPPPSENAANGAAQNSQQVKGRMPLEYQPAVPPIVERLEHLESVLGELERTTKRGLTHARFGLGPSNLSTPGFGPETGKAGQGIGETGKAGQGIGETGKAGQGPETPKAGQGLTTADSGDLRGDLALDRVASLFAEVGLAMRRLEFAVSDVEGTARNVMTSPGDGPFSNEASAQEILETFRTLEEVSAAARRTIRRVLSHPVYGLGPGDGDVPADLRQEFASRGGLDRTRLTLL